MKTEYQNQEDQKAKGADWLPAYTWVLVANAIYILLFFILMKSLG